MSDNWKTAAQSWEQRALTAEAKLKIAVNALERPFQCVVCEDREPEPCGRACPATGGQHRCKFEFNVKSALTQVGSEPKKQDTLLSNCPFCGAKKGTWHKYACKMMTPARLEQKDEK